MNNKIYKIDLKNKKRKLLVKNKEKINHLFVTGNGDIYYTDSGLKKYKNKKIFKIKVELSNKSHIWINYLNNFVIHWDNLIYLDRLHKWYFKYNFDTKEITHFLKENKYSYLSVKDWILIVTDELWDIEFVDIEEEFKNKYWSKLEKIKEKLDKMSLSEKQKDKLKRSIEKFRRGKAKLN